MRVNARRHDGRNRDRYFWTLLSRFMQLFFDLGPARSAFFPRKSRVPRAGRGRRICPTQLQTVGGASGARSTIVADMGGVL